MSCQKSLAAAIVLLLGCWTALFAPDAPPSYGIDIVFDYDDEGENPWWDEDGAILRTMFEAAAVYWEPIFPYTDVYVQQIEYDDEISGLGMWSPPGPFSPEGIEIHPGRNWWIDPTPWESSEFNFSGAAAISYPGQTFVSELTAAQQTEWFDGPVPPLLEVGYRGQGISGIASNQYDMLSVCIHELGHALGVNFQALPDEWELYPQHVGGALDVQVEANSLTGHLAVESSLMTEGLPHGVRVLPSAIDILAVAADDEDYTTVYMPRSEFLNRNNNFSDPLNWIGGKPGAATAATVRRGTSAVNAAAAADIFMLDLTLRDDSRVSTGSSTIDVFRTLTIDGSSAAVEPMLKIDSGGNVTTTTARLLYGGQIQMFGGLLQADRLEVVGGFTGQFAMLPGATLRVNELVGFGDDLAFLGNLEIGHTRMDGGLVNLGADQSLIVFGTTTVGAGPGGSGAVNLSAGAFANLHGGLKIGTNSSSGAVTVRGYSPSQTALNVIGNLNVGSGGLGAGTMTVELFSAGDVTGNAAVGGSSDAPGQLFVKSGATLDVANRLDVLASGRVELSGAWTTLTANELAVSPGGSFIDGAGTILRVNRLIGFGNHPEFAGSVELGHPGSVASHWVSAGQSLDVAEYLTIGDDAPATLSITGGGMVESGRSFIGRNSGSAGSGVQVGGGGSRWDVLDQLYVGGSEGGASGGRANLTISNGGQVNVEYLMEVAPGGSAVVGAYSTSATLTVDNILRIHSGGMVTVGTGGHLHANLIDFSTGGSLNTTGANSTVYTNGFQGLGSTLAINGNLGVGWSGGSGGGSLTIDAGQTLSVSSVLYLGDNSSGMLTVRGGGQATIRQAHIGDNGAGSLVVTGPSSRMTQTDTFFVGLWGPDASGSVRIEDGGAILANNQTALVAAAAGSTGNVLIHGANSRWDDLGALYIGGDTTGSKGAGTVTVSGGGLLDVNSVLQVWSTGRLELLGSEIRAGSFNVQSGGTFVHQDGKLTVDGGAFQPGPVYNYSVDGAAAGQACEVLLRSGATANIPGTLFVGYNNAGKWRLESGAVTASLNGRIGWDAAASDGQATVDGANSRWTNSADLEIGVRRHGAMVVSNGGLVENTIGAIAVVPGSSGEVTVSSGGQWRNSAALYIGGRSSAGGPATLTLGDDAQVWADSVMIWPAGAVELSPRSGNDASLVAESVYNEGRLAGTGGVFLTDELTNAGVVAPAATPDSLALSDGDYIQMAQGRLSLQISDDGDRDWDYGRLRISSGQASLSGGLEVDLVGRLSPPAGSMFTILAADDGVFGKFDPALSNLEPLGGDLAWSLDYLPTSVVLRVVQAGPSGDFDLDGDVDGGDLAAWQEGFGLTSGATADQGDSDRDGDVDGGDFLTWQNQFTGPDAPLPIVQRPVPEPSAGWLLAAAIAGLLGRVVRRQ
ncbi:MAG: hypothetical protein IT424_01145 [Pirellulales bacterium]|nr:hypothetical protein [Pirellulales bacterium]